jgi:hypothetical protein
MIATKSFAQISESFETQADFTQLIGECWTFNTVSHTSVNVVTGIGSVVSQLNSTSQITTPYLNMGSSVTINFDYERVGVSGGNRALKILLVDTAGVQTVLDNFNLNDASVHTYSNTFTNANTPGNHFPLQGKIMFQFSDNVSVSFDDLTISAPLYYPGGCPPSNSPLPVKLISFQGNMNSGKVSLNWAVAENEINDHFEVERSLDGKIFGTAGVVVATAKYGAETYSFSETMNSDKAYYRLKMFDKNQVVTYSKILVFQTRVAGNSNALKIVNNPATDKLTLSFSSTRNQSVEIKVYDLAGRLQMNQKINVYQGSNLISLQLGSAFKTGMYAVDVNTGSERETAKFVKQ